MKKKKEILLLAYTNLNFGDDMFIKTICQFFPQQQFVLEAPRKYKEVMKDENNLRILVLSDQNFIIKFLRKIDNIIWHFFSFKPLRELWIKRFRAVVYVIGALFDEDLNWNLSRKKYGEKKYSKMLWQNSCVSGVPFFLLGSNMTNVFTNMYIHDMERSFASLYDICFRDQYSYGLFQHLDNVRYAPDIVFNYKHNDDICTKKKKVLISVWGVLTRCQQYKQWAWAEKYWIGYFEFMVHIVECFLEKDIEVELLALCENEGDLDACNQIAQKVKHYSGLKISVYNGNLTETIQSIAEARFVVGTRFHSIVLSLLLNIPFYPIVYESKTKQLLEDLNYNGEYAELSAIKLEQVSDVVAAYKKNMAINCDIYKDKASNQFAKLQDILG